MFATVIALLSGVSALRPETGASRKGVANARSFDFDVQPDFESRPVEQGLGDCAIYKDTLPGDALGDSSHSTIMALQFHDGAAEATQRQRIFNLGQEGHMAERWSWSAHRGVDSIQFGAWGNKEFGSGQIRSAGIANARTISTTYDSDTKNYSLYLNSVLSSSLILDQRHVGKDHGLNIESGQMLLGDRGDHTRDIDFRGCIEGVDVYLRMLGPDEVAAASQRLLASVEPAPEIAPETAPELWETTAPELGETLAETSIENVTVSELESAVELILGELIPKHTAEASLETTAEDTQENTADSELWSEPNELPTPELPELAPESLVHLESAAELAQELALETSKLAPELAPEATEATPEPTAPTATGLKHPVVRASMAIALCAACIFAAFAPTQQ